MTLGQNCLIFSTLFRTQDFLETVLLVTQLTQIRLSRHKYVVVTVNSFGNVLQIKLAKRVAILKAVSSS